LVTREIIAVRAELSINIIFDNIPFLQGHPRIKKLVFLLLALLVHQ